MITQTISSGLSEKNSDLRVARLSSEGLNGWSFKYVQSAARQVGGPPSTTSPLTAYSDSANTDKNTKWPNSNQEHSLFREERWVSSAEHRFFHTKEMKWRQNCPLNWRAFWCASRDRTPRGTDYEWNFGIFEECDRSWNSGLEVKMMHWEKTLLSYWILRMILRLPWASSPKRDDPFSAQAEFSFCRIRLSGIAGLRSLSNKWTLARPLQVNYKAFSFLIGIEFDWKLSTLTDNWNT